MTIASSPNIDQPMPPTVADSWVDEALCAQVDPEVFFPATKGGTSAHDIQFDTARSICNTCPVLTQCLEAAMKFEEGTTHYSRYGMFGGLTPVERADLAGNKPKRRSKKRAGH
ncbi:WhiB family transcriptional regulator [Yaniella flava]|uniref:WhiB family transcriptional regulator n=1 Tax=Yaniella flava TaxID=287930 RepID=A0ABN2UI01_9MICC|nr:WhiB family transcriptional regulator [Micrococcaceae bacterium]